MADHVYVQLAFPDSAGPSAVTITAGVAEATAAGSDPVAVAPGVAAPRIVVLATQGATRMAPHTVHVRLDGTDTTDTYTMNATTGNSGDWSTLNVSWDFGDPGVHMVDDPRPGKTGQFDLSSDQRGFNACFIYTTPGVKTISVTVWNEDGDSGTDSTQVTIAASTRVERYVDGTSGSDGGDGSISAPWKNFNYAISQVNASGNATKLMLRRGTTSTFTSPTVATISVNNTWITTYGSTGDAIITPHATPHTCMSIAAENVIVDGVRINAGSYAAAANCFDCRASHLHNFTAKDITTNSTVNGNRWDIFVNWAPGAFVHKNGLCVLNAQVDNVETNGGFEKYNWGAQGNADACILGGVFGGSDDSHIFRPTQGYGVAYNDTESGRRLKLEFVYARGYDSGSLDTLRFSSFHWLFASRCYFNKAGEFRLSFQNNITRWGVLECNYWTSRPKSGDNPTCIFANNHSEYLMVRDNVFDCSGRWALLLGTSASDAGAADNILEPKIYHNTFYIDDTDTNTARPIMQATVGSWTIVDMKINNNLNVCQFLNKSRYRLDGVSYFAQARNNVYPLTYSVFIDGRAAYSDKTFAEWQAMGHTSNEVQEDIALSSLTAPSFYTPAGSTADTHAVPADAPGCRWDYNGNVRNRNATNWSAGAAEGAFR